jgi:hypothetical protein
MFGFLLFFLRPFKPVTRVRIPLGSSPLPSENTREGASAGDSKRPPPTGQRHHSVTTARHFTGVQCTGCGVRNYPSAFSWCWVCGTRLASPVPAESPACGDGCGDGESIRSRPLADAALRRIAPRPAPTSVPGPGKLTILALVVAVGCQAPDRARDAEICARVLDGGRAVYPLTLSPTSWGEPTCIEGGGATMSLRPWRVELGEANAFVAREHRHHDPVTGHRFSIACGDTQLRGVAICGRPVAPGIDRRAVLEVLRVCTDGTRNACSWLYATAARCATAMGFRAAVTYTATTEGGASLRACGWWPEPLAERASYHWTTPSRPRDQRRSASVGPKVRWVWLTGNDVTPGPEAPQLSLAIGGAS